MGYGRIGNRRDSLCTHLLSSTLTGVSVFQNTLELEYYWNMLSRFRCNAITFIEKKKTKQKTKQNKKKQARFYAKM